MTTAAEQVTVIRAGMDPSNYLEGAAQIEAANDRLAQTGERVVQADERASRARVNAQSSFERLRRELDQAFRAQEQYERVQRQVQRAVEVAGVAQTEANRILDLARARHEAVAQAAERRAQAEEAAARRTAAATAVANQNAFNRVLGVREDDSGADYARRAADVAAYGAEIDRLRAAYVPLAGAAQQARRSIEEIEQAQRAGVLSAQESAAAIARVGAAYEQQASAAQRAVVAEREAVAARGQSAANTFAGVRAPTSDADYAKRAADMAAYGSALDALRDKFVPLAAVERQHAAALEEIARAERVGAISATERAAAVQRQTDAYQSQVRVLQGVTPVTAGVSAANDNAGRSYSALGAQVQNASYQVGDFAVQIASGQSAVTALAQQLPQLLGGFGVIGALSGAAVAIAAVVYNMVAAVDPAKALNEAIKQQDAIYQAATEAGERYRAGLDEEAKKVAELTGVYARYSEQRSEAEMRRLQDVRDALEGQQAALRARALGAAENLPSQLANAANLATRANLLRAGQGQNVEGISEQFTAAARAILEFKAAGEVTSEGLANLSNRLESAAGVAGGDLAQALLALAGRARELLPESDRIARSLEQNANQAAALQAAAPGAAQGIGAVGAAAAGAADSVTGLSGALGEAVRRLAQLRRDQLDNPFVDLERGVATLRNQASALARGDNDGSEAIERRERMRQQFEQQREKLLKEQEEAMARAGSSEADRQQARVEGERRILQLQGEYFRLSEANRAQEEANRKAEEAARKAAAERRRTARSEEAAAARQRREDAEFERQLALRTFADGRTDAQTRTPLLNQSDVIALEAARRQFAPVQQERERVEKEIEQLNQHVANDNARMVDTITDYFGDSFARIFDKTGGGFEAMLDSFQRSAISTFGRIAAQAIIKPIVAPIVAGLNGTEVGSLLGVGSTAAAAAGATGTGSSGGIISSLGLGGIGTTIKGYLDTKLIGDSSLGQLLGGAGLGFGAGSILNRLAGGKTLGGSIGSGLGGIGGAALGAAFPVVGPLIGGLLGGAGGGLLGGLFGANKGFSGGVGRIGINEEGGLYLSSTAGKRTDMAQVEAQTKALIAQVTATLKQAGVTLTGPAVASIAEQGFGEAKQDAAGDLLGNVRARGRTGNVFGDRALGSSKATTLEEVLGDAAWARDVFAPLVDGLSDFDRAQQDTRKGFEETIERARKLGFETGKVAEAMEAATAAALAQREATVQGIRDNLEARSLAARGETPSLDAQLASQQRSADREVLDLTTRLKALGYTPGEANGNYAEVNQALRVLGEEREALIRAYNSQVEANAAAIAAQRAALGRAGDYWTDLRATEGRGYIDQVFAARADINQRYAGLSEAGFGPDAIHALFKGQIEGILGGLTDSQIGDVVASFRDLDPTASALADAFLKAGRSADALAAANDNATRRASAQDNVSGALSGISGYVQQLRLGSDSSLSPAARLQETLEQFRAVAGAAAAGDFTSLTKVTQYADQYRQAATSFGASPGRADADRTILSLLEGIGNANLETLTASAQAEIMRTQTDRVVSALDRLTAGQNELRRENAALRLQLAGMVRAA